MSKKSILGLLFLFAAIVTGITIFSVANYNFNVEREDQLELLSTYSSVDIARRWINAHHYPIAENMFVCFTNPPEYHYISWHYCRGTFPDGHVEEFSCNHRECAPGNVLSKLK